MLSALPRAFFFTKHIQKYVLKVLTHIKICVIIYNVRGIVMKSYSSREVIAMLKADGWYEVSCEGSHHQFKHDTKKGKVTIKHPCKDIPPKTLKSIAIQSGLQF